MFWNTKIDKNWIPANFFIWIRIFISMFKQLIKEELINEGFFKDMVKNHYILHNHKVDKKEVNSKWNHQVKLERVSLNEMPEHVYNNPEFYSKWISE